MYYIKRVWPWMLGGLLILIAFWQTVQLASLKDDATQLADQVAVGQAEQNAMKDTMEALRPPSYIPTAETPTEPASTFQPLDIPLTPELQEHTYTLCEEYGIPFETVLALMFYESQFQLDAVGHNPNGTYDSGPMQINSINREWLLEDHGLDIIVVEDNIEAALLILAMHLEDGDLEYALTAYNAGATGATALGGKSAFADKVLEFDLEEVISP